MEKSKTDLKKLKEMTEEDLESAAHSDPDAQLLSDDELSGFRPNWIFHPSHHIRDIAQERDLSISFIAKILGYQNEHDSEFSSFMSEKIGVNESIAARLSYAFGNPATFWLKLQKKYEKHKKRIDKEEDEALSRNIKSICDNIMSKIIK